MPECNVACSSIAQLGCPVTTNAGSQFMLILKVPVVGTPARRNIIERSSGQINDNGIPLTQINKRTGRQCYTGLKMLSGEQDFDGTG